MASEIRPVKLFVLFILGFVWPTAAAMKFTEAHLWLAGFGFGGSFLVSLLVSGFVASKGFGIFTGVCLLLASGVFAVLAFYKNDDNAKSANCIAVAISGALAGLLDIILDAKSNWHATNGGFARTIVYTLIAEGVFGFLGFAKVLLGDLLFPQFFTQVEWNANDQLRFFVVLDSVVALLIGVCISQSKGLAASTSREFKTGFCYTIVLCLISAGIHVVVGVLVGEAGARRTGIVGGPAPLLAESEYEKM
jgi:hypothetical protein